MNREMLKEAIAEAKTIKETAIASAKAALEEAFTPQLTAMFAERLNEMDDEKGVEENYSSDDQDLSLEEILAELGVTEDDAMMKEGDNTEKLDEDLMLEEMSDEDIEELVTQVIDDMIASGKLMAGEESEEDLEDMDDMDIDDMGDDVEVKDDEEIKIDELLAEIESLEKKEMEEGYEEAGTDIALQLADMLNISAEQVNMLAALLPVAAIGTMFVAPKVKELFQKLKAKVGDKKVNTTTDTKEMEETINELKKELNEVNLLNAKLLYTNKIFKAKNLTESEKVKVLNTFDKAETVKEVKLVFETLTESFKTTVKKNPIKESLGGASKTVVAAPKQKEQIIEVNDAFARMQRLAGLR